MSGVAQTPAFASFGPRSEILQPYIVTCPKRIRIGADVHIGERSWLSVVDEHLGRSYEPELVIGDGTSLGPDLVIACMGRVEIGERVLSASRVFIGDAYHDYRQPDTAIIDQPMSDPNPVRIGDGAFLGINSIVLPGVQIGARAYVAAGAVVTHDVPDNTVVAGNPAGILTTWDPAQARWVRPAPAAGISNGQVQRLQTRVSDTLRAARQRTRRGRSVS